MGKRIRIKAGSVLLEAELNDTPTAEKVAESLPLRSTVSTWGEEIYFSIPVSADLAEDARAEVAVGDIGYWPPGSAMCVFFGRTPASVNDEPKAASPVNLIGRVLGDAKALSAVRDGDVVTVEAG